MAWHRLWEGGKVDRGSKILGDLQEMSKHRYISPLLRGGILAYTGGKKDEGPIPVEESLKLALQIAEAQPTREGLDLDL